jgi:uncharacterized protein
MCMDKIDWVMKQTWYHLLFAHWRIDVDIIKQWIPPPLELDTFDGEAWIGIVPFEMKGIRLRYLPPVPFTSKFPEINVRTYVSYQGKSGVYFLSLDATNYLAVQVAKSFFHLPYYFADISVMQERDTIVYRSKRKEGDRPFRFEGSYRPTSPEFLASPDSLEHWLSERYCFFTRKYEKLLCCDIVHDPWKLQLAEADITRNQLLPFDTTALMGKPLLHYSNHLDVLIRGIHEVTSC